MEQTISISVNILIKEVNVQVVQVAADAFSHKKHYSKVHPELSFHLKIEINKPSDLGQGAIKSLMFPLNGQRHTYHTMGPRYAHAKYKFPIRIGRIIEWIIERKRTCEWLRPRTCYSLLISLGLCLLLFLRIMNRQSQSEADPEIISIHDQLPVSSRLLVDSCDSKDWFDSTVPNGTISDIQLLLRVSPSDYHVSAERINLFRSAVAPPDQKRCTECTDCSIARCSARMHIAATVSYGPFS